jgi:hypothetical protein
MIVATIPDWHAVNVLFFHTPKGKLDANDKLFKMIVSTTEVVVQSAKNR